MARGDITGEAVLETLEEAKRLGRDEFNRRHGFRRALRYELHHEGLTFDSKAIYGVAYDRLHPDEDRIRESGKYSGGIGRVVPELRELGFDVSEPAEDRAWLVRAGSEAEGVEYALNNSRVVIGWDQFDDLDPYRKYDRLLDLVRADYGADERPDSTVTRHTNELYAFLNDVEVGEVVVMPIDSTQMAVGEIVGDYEYDAGTPAGCHHYRQVRWLDKEVARGKFPPDYQTTISARATVRQFPDPFAGKTIRDLISTTSGPQSWIFQANPTRWDLRRALDELPVFEYEVNQNQKEIQAGDTVYLWLSGPSGGVCGSARVLTDPAEIPLRLRRFDPYGLTEKPTDDGKLRVWLRVIRALDEPILRDWLKDRPETAGLPVLLFANATNFKLSETHALELATLLAERSGRDVSGEKLFFFTASDAHAVHHLQTSLVDGIPLDDLAELSEVKSALEYHADNGRVFAWGARPGSSAEKKWERLNPGDVCLVYRSGQFVLWGRLYAKTRSEDVAKRIWGDAGGDETWGCMYFLDPVVKLGTARQDVVTALGYKPNFIPQGFEIPGESTQDVILQRYPTLLHFVDALSKSDPKPPPPPVPPAPSDYAEPSLDHIQTHMKKIGLRVSDESLRQYHLSLKTRGFVVLAGISGGGKTWLAEAYADAVGAEPLVVAVAPNWTTNEDLLGYRSPIDNEYRHTPFSVFLQEASKAHASALASNTTPQPFHLILDEMNLARVEYYFARFLSAMELRARHGVASLELAPDLHVDLTPNLKFIGTVNIDETTFGFADKVYDRAQLVTLHVERDDLAEHVDGQPHAARVLDIWDALREVAPFAYRVLDEIAAYVKEADKIGVSWQDAVDDQLEQKVLPKVKGADQRIKPALEAFISLTKADMPRSSAKAQRMLDAYNAHGFASYF